MNEKLAYNLNSNKWTIPSPMITIAMVNAPTALLCSMTPGTADTTKMICPTKVIAMATQIVLKRPRCESATYAPKSGVI